MKINGTIPVHPSPNQKCGIIALCLLLWACDSNPPPSPLAPLAGDWACDVLETTQSYSLCMLSPSKTIERKTTITVGVIDDFTITVNGNRWKASGEWPIGTATPLYPLQKGGACGGQPETGRLSYGSSFLGMDFFGKNSTCPGPGAGACGGYYDYHSIYRCRHF